MVGLRSKKQVLIVGNDGLQLYVVTGKRVSLFRDFPVITQTTGDELRHHFKTIGAPLVILFDVVEQQYRKETLPKVTFLDKNKVIQRKLLMAFPQQQMRAYLPLQQKGREENQVALFAGLSTDITSTIILDAVIASEVALIGAGLLPLESVSLVKKLVETTHKRAKTPNDTRWSILMTHHKTGGLRQLVIKDGELALTRMTPLVVGPNDPARLADEMVREFNATLTYLSRFGFIPSDGLDLLVVSSAQVAEKFRTYKLPVNHLYPLTVQEAGDLAGIVPMQNPDMQVYGEIIHAGWTGHQRSLFVPLSASLMDKVKQLRAIARLLILLLIVSTFYLVWQNGNLQTSNMTLQGEITDEQARHIVLQVQHDELSKKLNTLKYDPEKIRVMLEIYDQYKKRQLNIEPTLSAIISLLERDKITLKKIEIADENPDGQTPDPNAPPPEPVVLTSRIPDAADAAAADAAARNAPKANIVIKLKIGFPENTAIETAAVYTNDFAAKLRDRFPGRTVTVSEMIGDLAIDKTVQGISEQVEQGRIEGGIVKEAGSVITILGAAE